MTLADNHDDACHGAPEFMHFSDMLVDYCTNNPDDTFAHVIDLERSEDSTLDVREITAAQLLSDGRLAADYLSKATGIRKESNGSSITVSILARSGYGYLTNVIGMFLIQFTPVLISTRNSLDAVISLVRDSKSQFLFVDEFNYAIGESVRQQVSGVNVVKVYDVKADTASSPMAHVTEFSRIESTSEMLDQPTFYLHSSGTTGHPKLIPIPNRTFIQRVRRLGEVKYVGHPALAPVPLFHTMGLSASFGWSVSAGLHTLIVEWNKPITGEVMIRIMQHYPRLVVLLAPATLIDMMQHGDVAIEALKSAHRVLFAGASLPRAVGDKLASRGVKLSTLFGTTETGGMAIIDLSSDDPNDWEYFRFKDTPDIVLVPVDGDTNTVQAHVKPGEFLPPSLVDPNDPIGFTSGDVFEEHPSKKGLWKHVGRKGSVTVLSNGEKTDNVQLESILLSDPLVSHAVVFGSGRFQNGVILLPESGASDLDPDAFLDAIEPTVQRANGIIPRHSRLIRSLILVAESGKGFRLTDKGTVRRQATLDLYEEKIEDAYARLEDEAVLPNSHTKLPQASDEEAVSRYVRKAVFDLLKVEVADEDDLFNKGLDSLGALTLRNALMPIILSSQPTSKPPRNLVYHFPTISQLTKFIKQGIVNSDHSSISSSSSDSEKVERLIGNLSLGLHYEDRIVPSGVTVSEDHTVLLTGSTGTFGCQILSILLQTPSVKKVLCLNRPNPSMDIFQRQQSQMDDPDILKQFEGRVKFMDFDISQDDLGLSKNALEEIRTSVTDIIHCAWDINFNHSLEHFVDTHISAVARIAKIALSSTRARLPRLYFISSIAAVGNYSGPNIPEEIIDDETVPLSQGYGQSKYVAERLLNAISTKTGLPVTVVRVGQLSGSSVTGLWNQREYVSILLQASFAIGKFPDWLPDLHWLPTDVAARALVNIMLAKKEEGVEVGAEVFHLENPAVTHGTEVVKWVIEAMHGQVMPVPFTQWLEAISTPSEQLRSKSVRSAERLFDFFQRWLDKDAYVGKGSLSVERTKSVTEVVDFSPVGEELIRLYVGHAACTI